MPSMTHVSAHVFLSGHSDLSRAVYSSPQLALELVFGWIRCLKESITTAVSSALQPPALVHFQVVSLGWSSGVVPIIWAEAKPKRVAVTSKESGMFAFLKSTVGNMIGKLFGTKSHVFLYHFFRVWPGPKMHAAVPSLDYMATQDVPASSS